MLGSPATNVRRHDLDALRAVAMLLGIALHGMISFIPMSGVFWGVQDVRAHTGFGYVLAAIHGFRMPLFFLISGFFTTMLWRQRGLRALLVHRFRRIFLPMLLSLVTIIPLTWYVTNHVRSVRTEPVNEVTGVRQTQHVFEAIEDATYDNIAAFATHFPLLGHLWFLWFLCWYVAGFACYVQLRHRRWFPMPPNGAIVTPRRYIWLVPLTAVLQFWMLQDRNDFGPSMSTTLVPLPVVLAYYAVFFFYGSIYYDAHDHAVRIGRDWWWMLPLSVSVLFPIGVLADDSGQLSGRVVASLAQSAYTWMMTFSMMGFFARFLSGATKTIRYLSDASYWLYLTHIPLIVYIQYVVADWDWPALVKFPLICLMASLILLASYQLFVRYTAIGTLLNGPRRRRGQLTAQWQPCAIVLTLPDEIADGTEVVPDRTAGEIGGP